MNIFPNNLLICLSVSHTIYTIVAPLKDSFKSLDNQMIDSQIRSQLMAQYVGLIYVTPLFNTYPNKLNVTLNHKKGINDKNHAFVRQLSDIELSL